MIQSVGIDFHQGHHRARCLDHGAQPCDGFSFDTSPEGLEMFEERVFRNGANPTIVLEPAGLPWLMVAVYLRARHPECRLVKAKMQKVAALRRYLRGPVKSDRVDALTLAKMPFIDPEQLDSVYLPPAEMHALQRLTRQRQRLESDISGHKIRIGAMIDSYLPGVRRAFNNVWSLQVRAFFKARLNPFAVVREGEAALHSFLTEASERNRNKSQTRLVYSVCVGIASLCRESRSVGTLTEEFFREFQEEISREIRLLEMAENESESVGRRIEELYRKLHPSNNLQSIPGVGEHTAPIFLAVVGDPLRFSSQSAFANWEGVVPGAKQSSEMEAKGLHMTKAGPSVMRMALYQAGEIARRNDPHLAALYFREMVQHGKNHRQAMGAVMSHLGARVLAVLKEDKPYELRDFKGHPIDRLEAKRIILSECYVSEEVRRARRLRNSRAAKKWETATVGINEAAASSSKRTSANRLPKISLAKEN